MLMHAAAADQQHSSKQQHAAVRVHPHEASVSSFVRGGRGCMGDEGKHSTHTQASTQRQNLQSSSTGSIYESTRTSSSAVCS